MNELVYVGDCPSAVVTHCGRGAMRSSLPPALLRLVLGLGGLCSTCLQNWGKYLGI